MAQNLKHVKSESVLPTQALYIRTASPEFVHPALVKWFRDIWGVTDSSKDSVDRLMKLSLRADKFTSRGYVVLIFLSLIVSSFRRDFQISPQLPTPVQFLPQVIVNLDNASVFGICLDFIAFPSTVFHSKI